MAKKVQWHRQLQSFVQNNRRAQAAALPILLIMCTAVVIAVVLSVLNTPKAAETSLYGVGADGFQAYVETGTDIGAQSIASKALVTSALGNKAKSVADAQISQVFNFNGNRSQAATYSFVRADRAKSTLYIDKKIYKNTQAIDNDYIYIATAKAGTVNGHPAYYRAAQTIGGNREYHIMIVNGLTAYRFVIAQPASNVTISEIDADAMLKKLAAKSQL